MKKIVIFNVGGASSAYAEIDEYKIILDLGKGEKFNPVLDFLLPLAKNRFERSPVNDEKFFLTQTFLSHLDDDHISAIEDFDRYFMPGYLTAPCDHPKQNILFRIIRSLFNLENENLQKVLSMMSEEGSRAPGHGTGSQEDQDRPLVVSRHIDPNILKLYHIPPHTCSIDEKLKGCYSNNLSLVLLFKLGEYRVLFTGDIMNEGMEHLLQQDQDFRKEVAEGIDFLITPHHGLSTSFPLSLFNTMRSGKVKLNIISEKLAKKKDTENRSDVDSRYSSPDYSEGYRIINGLKEFQYSIMTSNGLGTHILLDFESGLPVVKRCTSDELLTEFM